LNQLGMMVVDTEMADHLKKTAGAWKSSNIL